MIAGCISTKNQNDKLYLESINLGMIDEGFIRFQVSNISRSKQILLVKIDIRLSNVSIYT